jgi:hypothetical protein
MQNEGDKSNLRRISGIAFGKVTCEKECPILIGTFIFVRGCLVDIISKIKCDLEGPYFENDFEKRNITIVDIDINLGVWICDDCSQLRICVRQTNHR